MHSYFRYFINPFNLFNRDIRNKWRWWQTREGNITKEWEKLKDSYTNLAIGNFSKVQFHCLAGGDFTLASETVKFYNNNHQHHQYDHHHHHRLKNWILNKKSDFYVKSTCPLLFIKKKVGYIEDKQLNIFKTADTMTGQQHLYLHWLHGILGQRTSTDLISNVHY